MGYIYSLHHYSRNGPITYFSNNLALNPTEYTWKYLTRSTLHTTRNRCVIVLKCVLYTSGYDIKAMIHLTIDVHHRSLRWRHKWRDSVSNHQPYDCFDSAIYSDADERKHHSSASLAFVRGIHRGPVNCPQKWPVTRKMFPFDDVIELYQIIEAKPQYMRVRY